ncbi:hypothetical protein VTO73DRAFT_14252 [Trametes versicolor]
MCKHSRHSRRIPVRTPFPCTACLPRRRRVECASSSATILLAILTAPARPRGRHPPRGPPPAKYSRRRRYLARRAPQRDSWHRRPLWVPAFPTQGLDRAREAFQRRRDLSLRASDDGAPQTRTLGSVSRRREARSGQSAWPGPAGMTEARIVSRLRDRFEPAERTPAATERVRRAPLAGADCSVLQCWIRTCLGKVINKLPGHEKVSAWATACASVSVQFRARTRNLQPVRRIMILHHHLASR